LVTCRWHGHRAASRLGGHGALLAGSIGDAILVRGESGQSVRLAKHSQATGAGLQDQSVGLPELRADVVQPQTVTAGDQGSHTAPEVKITSHGLH
jgi:hypothetical protein